MAALRTLPVLAGAGRAPFAEFQQRKDLKIHDLIKRSGRAFGIFGTVAMLLSRSGFVKDFAIACLTFFRTISVKTALRIERGPEPQVRHRLSLSPQKHTTPP